MKCRDRVYKREFERFSGACFFTNTHGVLQVVWHKMRGVPVWTSFRHISIYTGLWRKLRSYNQRIVESVCINVNLSDFRVPIAPHIHMWRQCLCDSICVRYLCGLESPEYLYDCRSLAEVESIPTEMSSPCLLTWNLAVFDCPHLHKYRCDGSGCVTEYVWGTCVDLTPGYLCDCRSVADVESIKPLKCRVRVYKHEI